MKRIKFDSCGESKVFEIKNKNGEIEKIYFVNGPKLNQDDHKDKRYSNGKYYVAYADGGEPYSTTNHYIYFKTIKDAEEFLNFAIKNGGPRGW